MKIPALAVASIASLILPSVSQADVTDISVTVKGVTCPVCTHSINIGLRGVAGVKTVKISLATRVNVDVVVHPGAWIDPERIVKQIALVGFHANADEIMFHLDGDASVQNGSFELALNDVRPGPVRLILTMAGLTGSQAHNLAKSFTSLRSALTVSGARSEHVVVAGWWRAADEHGHLATLEVTEIAPVPANGAAITEAP